MIGRRLGLPAPRSVRAGGQCCDAGGLSTGEEPGTRRLAAEMALRRPGRPWNGSSLGLGLAVSRGLIDAMGGTLQPEETPGGGLTRTISLPAAPPDAVAKNS